MSDQLPEWISIGFAAAFGIGGLITAGLASGKAKNANDLAQTTNQLAADAVREAATANRIAHGANNLSKDANTLVRGQISQQNEDWFVKWEHEWEKETSMLTLTNKGRDAAYDISCVVSGDDIHEIGRPREDIAPGKFFRIDLQQVAERRNAVTAKNDRTLKDLSKSGVLWIPSAFQAHLEVTVIWKTGLGATKDQILKFEVE